MINSANCLEFLKSKLLTMDTYNSTTPTKLLPPSSFTQAKTFAATSDHQSNKAIDSLQKTVLLNNEMKNQDRVRVQHVENHTNLQNNKCCNTFRTLYNNISASSNVRETEIFQMHQIKDDTEIDFVDGEHLKSTAITPLDIQIKSAFHVDFNNKYHNNNRVAAGNNNYIGNNQNCYKQYNYYGHHNKQSETAMIAMTIESQKQTTDSQCAHDQDNAYRHIESVHNYAKSKSFEGDDDDKISPNGSRHSSYLSDDDDEEDDDEDNVAEYYNNDNIGYEDGLPDDLDADYEDIFSKRRYHGFQKISAAADDPFSIKTIKLISHQKISKELKEPASLHNIQHLKLNVNQIKSNCVDEEDHVDVDVETIEPQFSPITSVIDTNSLEESAGSVKPDHHARRPMNAFLIFCKRHRAIVKDRYKNLENRAITKILGDWWASLETNEKKCFTNLAQQNKDAFFSANPNFKWYKLPAPPLRTLTTRPANTFGQEFQEDNCANGVEMISNISSYQNNPGNYFKLADEAQMGDLSQLMQNKSKDSKQCADLQQALSETSQFMSTHIKRSCEILEENHLKRRFYNENSFSSNSSEEDFMEPKKKSARSCKGKRYQELINSGQIATVLKKSKSLSRQIDEDMVTNSDLNTKQKNYSNVYNLINMSNNDCQKRSLTESESMLSYDINSFDLEEKIKELPALNLDDYLQRKRNTKKKKKFSSNGKKKGHRTNNNAISRTDKNNHHVKHLSQEQLAKHYQQQPSSVVGSQKRKARKESITRRDVSSIEQEVASLLPLTINGCCYFQEAPTAVKHDKKENNSKADGITCQSHNFTSVSPIIPVPQNSLSSQNNTNVCNNNIVNDNISSSTSDLLILAEVAANRTEVKQ